MSKVTIRKMDVSDIPFVYKEEVKIFGNSLGEKTLYDELIYNQMSKYFIALDGRKRVGYIGSWLTRPNAEILNLLVIPSYRKKGIGKELVSKVIEVCSLEKIRMLTLEVRVSNEAAIKLYKSFGFTISHLRKAYYKDGEDANLMVLELE
jgi:ribosomal-protein-alanine N-acetyltransferase